MLRPDSRSTFANSGRERADAGRRAQRGSRHEWRMADRARSKFGEEAALGLVVAHPASIGRHPFFSYLSACPLTIHTCLSKLNSPTDGHKRGLLSPHARISCGADAGRLCVSRDSEGLIPLSLSLAFVLPAAPSSARRRARGRRDRVPRHGRRRLWTRVPSWREQIRIDGKGSQGLDSSPGNARDDDAGGSECPLTRHTRRARTPAPGGRRKKRKGDWQRK